MYRLTRNLSFIGIPAAVAIVILLTWMFRVIAINDLIYQSENHNRILSKTLSNVLWPQIRGFRDALSQKEVKNSSNNPEPHYAFNVIKILLDEPMSQLLEGTNVLKVKIFNLENIVIYSTDSKIIGKRYDESHNALADAKQGKIISHFDFRKVFDSWDNSHLSDIQIVSSYLPVQNADNNEIEAIFETYSDVTVLYNHLHDNLKRFAIMLSITFATILSVVLLIVRRLDKTIRNNTELSVAHNTATAANLAKSRFLANMSHELRTPLNAIIGYSELIAEDAMDNNSQNAVRDVNKIKSAGRHLLRLINEILDLSKIEAGQMNVFIENVDVSRMMKDVNTIIKPLLVRNNNEYHFFCDDGLHIKSDMTKLRQIIINLLSNAAKFCQNGQVSLTVLQKKSGLVFLVKDNGIGMSDAQTKSLFKPFEQADDSTTRKYGGTGLGLAISKQFCDMLAGTISVETKLEHGTTFTVFIPNASEQNSKTVTDISSSKRNAA